MAKERSHRDREKEQSPADLSAAVKKAAKQQGLSTKEWVQAALISQLPQRSLPSKKRKMTGKRRSKEDLPDPTQASNAEVNRPNKQLKVRVEPDLWGNLKDHLHDTGQEQSSFVEEAIRERIAREQEEQREPEGPEEQDGLLPDPLDKGPFPE